MSLHSGFTCDRFNLSDAVTNGKTMVVALSLQNLTDGVRKARRLSSDTGYGQEGLP